MKIAREGKLQQVLDEMGVKNPRSHEIPFSLLVEHIDTAMQQQTHVDVEHRIAIGLVRAIAATKGNAKKKRFGWIRALPLGALLTFLLLLLASQGHAQTPSVNVTRVGGTLLSGTNPVDTGNQAFRVNCVTGCSAAASFPDMTAFVFGTTAVGNMSAVVDDVATNTVAENSAGAVRMNTNRILYVDLSKSVANTNKFLVTPDPITFASPQHVIADASSAVIGHVIADTGSTTAVTGNVTAVQPTGTNLHTVIDSGTITTVTTVTAVTAITNALPAGANVIGKTSVDQTTPGTTNAVEVLPDTIAGVALTASAKATLTTAVVVKASAGNVYGLSVTNGAASICWIEFMNASSSPVLGTAPIFSVALPASGTVNFQPGNLPLANFSTGISVGIATLVNGSTACGTAGNATIFYK